VSDLTGIAKGLTEEDLRKVEDYCRDELSTYMLYEALASEESGELSEKLRQAAEQERGHYLFWRSLLGRDCSASPPGRAFRALYKVFGPVFTLQALERREASAASEYRRFLSRAPQELRPKLESIIADEEGHESEFIRSLNDVRVQYLGFVALGMADAITELVGVYAGFLGATTRTLIVGLAGLLVGFSAAISMAAAAFLQSRQEGSVRPGLSAAATGLSYFVTALLLGIPYLLLSSTAAALVASLIIGVVILAAFHFYSATVNGTSFARELAVGLLILLGATAAGLLFGYVIGRAFHLSSLFAGSLELLA
jgi:VIT1/CCC1 family predicted Fe2+/Mn2+ transporter